MRRGVVIALSSVAATLLMLLIGFGAFHAQASNGSPVHNVDTGLSYLTVQEAIDAAETLNGHTLLVGPGTFYGSVVVHKSLSIMGDSQYNTTIIANKTATAIHVIANHVTVKELAVSNGSIGIHIDNSHGSVVEDNTLFNNVDAVKMSYSTNCTISHNTVINSSQRGIFVTSSQNFTVSYNFVRDLGWYGINANASSDGKILQNDVSRAFFDGVGLLNSTRCRIAANNVTDNTSFGIWISASTNNSIYHNNIIGNGITATSAGNFWNSSHEGNYWDNYIGVDADHDGIGDAPHTIEGENRDFHPLMGRFHSFDTSLGYQINVISNSTIEDFEYFEANNTIIMHVSNSSEAQTHGFCRVRIPHVVMTPTSISVVIDNGSVPALHTNYTLQDDGGHRWIYFAYTHPLRRIDIVHESPSVLMLVPLVAVCVFAVFARKHRRHQQLQTTRELTSEQDIFRHP